MWREIAIVRNEGARGLAAQRLLDHRMAAGGDLEHPAIVNQRAAVALLLGEGCKTGGDVNHGERPGGGLDRLCSGNHLRHHPVEGRQFERERLTGCVCNPAFEVGEFCRREAHGVRHGLAMDEAGLGLVRVGHRPCIARGHLDEIAKHVVVLDLQRLDAGFLGIL